MEPPSADDQRTAELQQTLYTIANLQNGMQYTIAVSVGADNACSVTGAPAGNAVGTDADDPDDPEPVPAVPFAGLVALVLMLAAGGHLRRRRPATGA